MKQLSISDRFRSLIPCSRKAEAEIMNNLWVYIIWAPAFLDLKLWPWKLLEMKDMLISNKSVSHFCEKIYIFQITGGFDDIFKQGWEFYPQSYRKYYNFKGEIIFSKNETPLLLEISLSFISGRFRDPNFKFRKTGAHFM